MRRMMHRSMGPMALVATLALTGCVGQSDATFDESAVNLTEGTEGDLGDDEDLVDDATGEDDSTGDDEAGDDDEAGSTSAPVAARAASAGLVEVAWADAPRELTDIEREFMYEPGPFAEAYDEEQVIAAVLAMEPQTTQEWQDAIRAQIQGDYAEDIKSVITFDPNVGEVGERPTEGSPEAIEGEEAAVGTNHFALVLDASGSMAAASGSGTRMEEAKEALNGFVEALPANSTVSLRVYGHAGDNTRANRDLSCSETEQVYSGPADLDGFSTALDAVQPTGFTPLARGITEAADDFPADATDGIVYVVTDGLETCDGDPVAAARELSSSGLQPIINVVGFQTEGADQEALEAIAAAGGGEFTHVDSQEQFEQFWAEERRRMMNAWNEWKRTELARINEDGRARIADANEVGRRLMAGVNEQGRRGMAIANELGRRDHLDFSEKNAVWSYFYNRKNAMWSYAYNTKNANWSGAYNSKNSAWSDVYREGNAKWSEYYQRRDG